MFSDQIKIPKRFSNQIKNKTVTSLENEAKNKPKKTQKKPIPSEVTMVTSLENEASEDSSLYKGQSGQSQARKARQPRVKINQNKIHKKPNPKRGKRGDRGYLARISASTKVSQVNPKRGDRGYHGNLASKTRLKIAKKNQKKPRLPW